MSLRLVLFGCFGKKISSGLGGLPNWWAPFAPFLHTPANFLQYRVVDGKIQVDLVNGFGVLEIGDLPDNDTIIDLIGEDWHTHADLLHTTRASTDEEVVIFNKKQ